MTSNLSTFTFPFTSIDQSVHIADGSSIPVRSQSDAYLSPDTTLSSVYFVPNFAFSLLSENRLAKIIIVPLCSYPIVATCRT